MQAGNRVVFDADTHTKVVQSEIYRGLVVPFIGKTIAATQIEFEEVNQALKRRVEQDPAPHNRPQTAWPLERAGTYPVMLSTPRWLRKRRQRRGAR